jgi:putative acetyltransferase
MNDNETLITRPESPGDETAIHAVNEAAFDTAMEADLVDRLRRKAEPFISWVAVRDDVIVGHILFTPVTITSDGDTYRALGLAPMAVLPDYQRSGIGSRLVQAGLEACREAGVEVIVVLGHPEYYPRFGFEPASRHGLRCEYDVPDEVFMALELRPGALAERGDLVRYHPEFNEL